MKYFWYYTKQIHSLKGKLLYINLLGMVIISILDSAGIFLIIPLLNLSGIFESDFTGQTPINQISRFFNFFPSQWSLVIVLGIYILIMLFQAFFQRSQLILNSKIQQGFHRHLREETYAALVQTKWEFFLSKRRSDIINMIINEVGKVSSGTILFLQFLSSLIFTLVQIGIALWLSFKMTSLVLLFGVIIIIFSRKFIKNSTSIGKNAFELNRSYVAGITDHISGMKDIKSNNLEMTNIKWITTLCKRIEENFIEFTRLSAKSQFNYKVVSSVLIALFVFCFIRLFHAQPEQLMLIAIIFSRLWPRFTSIQSNLEQLGSIIPSFKELVYLHEQCKDSREIYASDFKSSRKIEIKSSINLENVYFKYKKNESNYTLQDININIPANQMTAIVGPSGAGKSTLIDLLMGLIKPDEGTVIFDGEVLTRENLLPFRRSISYVPQDPFLFSDSLRNNLLIAKPDASDMEMWDALEFAAATDFVGNLPQRLDTIIGDRGIRLSGGERQRIVLARAFLRKPSILVLDEATSSLDTENESKIQEAIDRLKGKMTIVVIAHRLSTIRNADQVIVLDKGRIIQFGGFKQLANEKKGMFSTLLGKQMQVSNLN